jgi:hypothetical protein
MAGLFDIGSDLLQLLSVIEEADGEITPEIAEQLEITEGQLEEKLKAYYSLIKLKEAEAQVIKDEAARLTKKAKASENLALRLRERVKQAVEAFGTVNPKTGTKGIKYLDLNLYLTKKPKVVYPDELEAIHIQKVIDIVNRAANDPREGVNVLDELTEEEKIIANSSSGTIVGKFSINQLTMIERLLGGEVPIEFNIGIGRDALKQAMIEHDIFSITEGDEEHKMELKLDKENTFINMR